MSLWLRRGPCVDYHGLLLCFLCAIRWRARLQLLLSQISVSFRENSTHWLRQVIISGDIRVLWDALTVAGPAEVVEFVTAALFAG